MTERDDLIREALAVIDRDVEALQNLDPAELRGILIRALESRPSLVVRGEEELAKGLANAGVERGYVGGEAFRAHVARALTESGVVRVAPSLVAASREAVIEALVEAQKPKLVHTAVGGPGHYVFPTSEQIADALLAPGGPVQVVEATAEQAYEERWFPIDTNGEEWAPRTEAECDELIAGYADPGHYVHKPRNADMAYAVAKRGERRRVGPWEPYVGNSRKEQGE